MGVPETFGSFVAAIPPPLAMGSIELDTGDWVNGFVCERWRSARADDITAFGGWRPSRRAPRLTFDDELLWLAPASRFMKRRGLRQA